MNLGVFWPLKLFRDSKKYEPHADDVKPYLWNGKKLMGVILPQDDRPLPIPPLGEPGCIMLCQESGVQAVLEDVVDNEAGFFGSPIISPDGCCNSPFMVLCSFRFTLAFKVALVL